MGYPFRRYTSEKDGLGRVPPILQPFSIQKSCHVAFLSSEDALPRCFSVLNVDDFVKSPDPPFRKAFSKTVRRCAKFQER